MARYNQMFPSEVDSSITTLSQIRDAHRRYQSSSRSGEFTLARLEGNNIVFLLKKGKNSQEQKQRFWYRMDGEFAVLMQRALSGESGTMVALDYRGVEVLAAFEPVDMLNLGGGCQGGSGGDSCAIHRGHCRLHPHWLPNWISCSAEHRSGGAEVGAVSSI